jgi:hypothetical protein
MSLWRKLFGGGNEQNSPQTPNCSIDPRIEQLPEMSQRASVPKPNPTTTAPPLPKVRQVDPALDEMIIQAVSDGKTDEVGSLIARGANANAVKKEESINFRDYSRTVCSRPLIHLAIELGSWQHSEQERRVAQPILEALVKAGADVNSRDERNQNMTPLMAVSQSNGPGAAKTVKYLIEKGASTDLKDANGRTAFGLIRAENDGAYNAVLSVLAHSTRDGQAWLLTEDGKSWERANSLDLSAPVKAPATEVTKILQNALGGKDEECLKRIIRWVEAGGDLDWRTPNGWTLLHLAARMGNEDLVRLLLSHGVKIDARDNRGETPLILVCDFGWYWGSRGRPDIVRLLLENGADARARDSNGNSSLDLLGIPYEFRERWIGVESDIAKILRERGAEW